MTPVRTGPFPTTSLPLARDQRRLADFDAGDVGDRVERCPGVPPISALMPSSRARGLGPGWDCAARATPVARQRTTRCMRFIRRSGLCHMPRRSREADGGRNQGCVRDSRNAAISWSLRTSRTSPTSTGWFQVLPSSAWEPRDLRELIGRRLDQRQLTLFRQHQQQVLIGQQHELAVAVASALPLARAVPQIDAREDAAVEAVGVALVHDEVVEVRLQPVRRPALRRRPSAGRCARSRGGASRCPRSCGWC